MVRWLFPMGSDRIYPADFFAPYSASIRNQRNRTKALMCVRFLRLRPALLYSSIVLSAISLSFSPHLFHDFLGTEAKSLHLREQVLLYRHGGGCCVLEGRLDVAFVHPCVVKHLNNNWKIKSCHNATISLFIYHTPWTMRWENRITIAEQEL